MKIKKLNIEPVETGINLDVDGAPEGIHIEWELIPRLVTLFTKLHDNHVGLDNLDTSARFSGVDIVRHVRNGTDMTTFYFPGDLRALEFHTGEAKEFAEVIQELTKLPRQVTSHIGSNSSDATS